MKKMIEIGMILVVLLSMVGFASASQPKVTNEMFVDIPSNTVNQYPVTYEPATAGVTTIMFGIYEQDVNDQWTILTNEVEGKIDNGIWEIENTTGVTTLNVANDGTTDWATWTFSIRDKDDTTDENDANQIDRQYKVKFWCDSIPVETNLVGYADSFAYGIPEFPTIALPVAAILGLAFIFQRRREED